MNENIIKSGNGFSVQSSIDLDNNTSTTTFSTFPKYYTEKMVSFEEFENRIEVVYTEKSDLCYTTYPPTYPERRVYKIIYSIVDGKWNKSDKIYGEIIPVQGETYEF